jgi:X-Pro dipeptidyl-peptidase
VRQNGVHPRRVRDITEAPILREAAMTRYRGRLVALAILMLTTMAGAPGASAVEPPGIVVADGVTQPVFDYGTAIRERVWVESDVDSEGNDELDLVAMHIIRPAASDEGLQVPVIMDASPYYTTVCRGNEGECMPRNSRRRPW